MHTCKPCENHTQTGNRLTTRLEKSLCGIFVHWRFFPAKGSLASPIKYTIKEKNSNYPNCCVFYWVFVISLLSKHSINIYLRLGWAEGVKQCPYCCCAHGALQCVLPALCSVKRGYCCEEASFAWLPLKTKILPISQIDWLNRLKPGSSLNGQLII